MIMMIVRIIIIIIIINITIKAIRTIMMSLSPTMALPGVVTTPKNSNSSSTTNTDKEEQQQTAARRRSDCSQTGQRISCSQLTPQGRSLGRTENTKRNMHTLLGFRGNFHASVVGTSGTLPAVTSLATDAQPPCTRPQLDPRAWTGCSTPALPLLAHLFITIRRLRSQKERPPPVHARPPVYEPPAAHACARRVSVVPCRTDKITSHAQVKNDCNIFLLPSWLLYKE